MMKNLYIFAIFFAIFFTGCAKTPEPYNYAPLLEKKPRSILVVMPTNDSVEPKGSAAMLANATLPLSEAGYYVFPVALVNDTFRANGILEAHDIINVPTKKLKEIFGADAALYINVEKYGTSYAVLSSYTEVEASAKLVDLDTATTLWEKSVYISHDPSSSNNLVAMLVSAVVDQIVDTLSDKGYEVSAMASNILFAPDCHNCLLRGERSPNFRKDNQLNK